MGHQVEGVLGWNQSNFDIHPVQQIPVLGGDVSVKAPHHVHLPAPNCQLSPDFQPTVVIALGVIKVVRRVPIKQACCQLSLRSIPTVVQSSFDVGPVRIGVFSLGEIRVSLRLTST